MKIVQMLTTMSYGDAIGNNVLALSNALKNNGFETEIYAENIDTRLSDGIVKRIENGVEVTNDDVILYHLSTGTKLNYELEKYQGRKIIIYHNITPPEFFKEYSANSYQLCADGIQGMKYLANIAEYALAVSNYNKKDLINVGYTCKIDILPILIPFEDYEKTPNQKILYKYQNDGYTNLLFTGRIAPNKKQEDVIRLFYQYSKYYNPKSRLFLVGSYGGMEKYYERLQAYVKELGLENVYFTGHIKFDEILAYYHLADAFICMSEHEGFCVPLVEAMHFEIPILAYDSSAIAGTLGEAGIVTKTKDPLLNAGILNKILQDKGLKMTMIENGKSRLQDFQHEKIEKQFITYVRQFLEEK